MWRKNTKGRAMVSLNSLLLSLLLHQSVGAFLHSCTTSPIRNRSIWARRRHCSSGVSQCKAISSRLESSAMECMDQQQQLSSSTEADIERAEQAHGMPWRTSLSISDDSNLFYMPFWEWQLRYMKDHLTDLKVVECTSKGSTQFPLLDKKFDYRESDETTSRIVSLCFTCKEYRRIRMTYFDNGQVGQSLNSVWYPSSQYNLPTLGVNLLSKSAINKHLAIIDFQPLHKTQEEHAQPFAHLQKAILQRHPELTADPTDRINKLQVFSPDYVCKRFTEEQMVTESVFPAYKEYIAAHVDLVKSTRPDPDMSDLVMKRQVAYDTYSSVRDPCTPLLGSLFGAQWAEEFVYGFLYSLSERQEEDYWEEDESSSSADAHDSSSST